MLSWGLTMPHADLIRGFEAAMAAAAANGACGAASGARASACNARSAAAAAPAKPAKPASPCPQETTLKGMAPPVAKKLGAGGASRDNVRAPEPARCPAPSASVAWTESDTEITLALDLPGREKKDVDLSIVDGGKYLDIKAPAVPADASGRRARPALHARVSLPAASAEIATRLDFARTAARMAAGELVVRIPKRPPPPPPQTWRVPVLSSEEEEEEEAEGAAGSRPATATPPAAEPAAKPVPAASDDDDEDGSWVEASSSDDDDEAEADATAARRKVKKGAPASGAVLEAVNDE